MKKTVSIKVLIIAVAFVVLVMATLFVFILSFFKTSHNEKNSNAQVLDIRHGDEFTGFNLYDGTSLKPTTMSLNEKNTIVFYVSASCSACKDFVDGYDEIKSVFGDSFNYNFLWLSDIPKDIATKYNIENNYSLNGETMFATSTPTIFILDNKNKVEFMTTELTDFIDKVISEKYIAIETLQQNAKQYIIDTYSKDVSNKKQLIYFSMEGCPDCEQADKVIENSEKLKEFEITKVYYKHAKLKNVKIDIYDLYAKIFNLQWYPSFLVINNDNVGFVGEVEMDTLEQAILNF